MDFKWVSFRWLKVFTNSTEPHLSQNAQFFEHATGKRVPCGHRDKENTITDRHDRNQVVWDSRGDRCTNEAQADRTGTPYYLIRRLAPDSNSTCKYYMPRSQFRKALIGATTRIMCVGTANKPGSWTVINKKSLQWIIEPIYLEIESSDWKWEHVKDGNWLL